MQRMNWHFTVCRIYFFKYSFVALIFKIFNCLFWLHPFSIFPHNPLFFIIIIIIVSSFFSMSSPIIYSLTNSVSSLFLSDLLIKYPPFSFTRLSAVTYVTESGLQRRSGSIISPKIFFIIIVTEASILFLLQPFNRIISSSFCFYFVCQRLVLFIYFFFLF